MSLTARAFYLRLGAGDFLFLVPASQYVRMQISQKGLYHSLLWLWLQQGDKITSLAAQVYGKFLFSTRSSTNKLFLSLPVPLPDNRS